MQRGGIEGTDEDENSQPNVLQSFLEQQCGVEPAGIEFQRVHRIGKPHRDASPRAIIAICSNKPAFSLDVVKRSGRERVCQSSFLLSA